MAGKDDAQRYGSRFKNDRVKSRNLCEKKRRDQFNMLINELGTMVSSNGRKMDKSSVLRSTISFLRNHRDLTVQQQSVEIKENWKPPFLSNEEFTHLMLEALDGFIIAFLSTGQILYVSENIASLLGYLPNDMCSSVFDMVHECDRSSLYTLINSPTENFLSIVVHMKHGPIYSQQTSSSYESVRLLGTFHPWPSSSSSPVEGSSVCNIECDSNSCSSMCSPLSSATVDWPLCFIAMARLQTPKLLRIVNLPDEPKKEFTSRHSLEWIFLYLDHRAPPIIGYLPFEVLGTSCYDYYHIDDLDGIADCHETLIQTGEGTSCFYRFLTKSQQWVWLQTRYFISYHQWSSKPEFIVCKNVVVSHEFVQNSTKKLAKQAGTLDEKPCFFNQAFSTHNQSSYLSPTLSVSSLGSLSSEHSGNCSGFQPVETIVNDISRLAQEVGLDKVTVGDVTELLENHGQPATNEDLEEFVAQLGQKKKEEKELPRREMKTSDLQRIVSDIDKLTDELCQIDYDWKRSISAKRSIMESMRPYHEILEEVEKKTLQSPPSAFFGEHGDPKPGTSSEN